MNNEEYLYGIYGIFAIGCCSFRNPLFRRIFVAFSEEISGKLEWNTHPLSHRIFNINDSIAVPIAAYTSHTPDTLRPTVQ